MAVIKPGRPRLLLDSWMGARHGRHRGTARIKGARNRGGYFRGVWNCRFYLADSLAAYIGGPVHLARECHPAARTGCVLRIVELRELLRLLSHCVVHGVSCAKRKIR